MYQNFPWRKISRISRRANFEIGLHNPKFEPKFGDRTEISVVHYCISKAYNNADGVTNQTIPVARDMVENRFLGALMLCSLASPYQFSVQLLVKRGSSVPSNQL